MARRITLGLLLLLAPFQGYAHEMRPAYAVIDASDLENVQVSFRQPVISGRYLDLQLQIPCRDVVAPIVRARPDAILQEWVADCSENGLDAVSVSGLSNTVIDVLLTFREQSGERVYVLTPDEPVANPGEAEKPLLPAYMALGVQHLLEGLDHVLFVIGLVMLVRGPRRLLITITSFTVAHSVTLALSVFDIVRLSQGPVEAVIALSLVFIALENASADRDRTLTARFPGVVAFSFGLLHGLGFAGVLREIGLPDDQVGAALLLFNIGIEIGQLIVIAVLLAAITLWRQLALPRGEIVRWVPVYFIGAISSYWVIDRVVTLLPA